MSQTAYEQLIRAGVIAIVRGIGSDSILPFAEALYRGGVSCIEIPFDQSGEAGIRETLRCIRVLNENSSGRFCVGAGTVLTTEQVHMALDAGAAYMIAPNVDEAVIRETKRLGAVSIPGALTPTEAVFAYGCGADIIKLFPAGLMGAAYVKALKTPLSHIPMTAVGNITLDNCADFVRAGCIGVCVGGALANVKLVNEGRFDEISRIAESFVSAVRI